MEEKKKGFFAKLVDGLTKTRDAVVQGIENVFSGYDTIDEDFFEELEETLIMLDVGIHASTVIIEELRAKIREENIRTPSECRNLLVNSLKARMRTDENAYEFENHRAAVLIIGVNGVGKTTTVGKLASNFKEKGKKILVAAADTFRAGAIEQLREWTNRAGVDLIAQQEGSDPAAVVYDACKAAAARGTDMLICDTAGRLHNKKNLMEELRKINRIIDREYPDVYRETLLVLDGTTGQNALEQARQFKEVAQISGLVLTKLDGTARGGIVIAIQSELGIPVKYIGVGEKLDDLNRFDADEFIDALFNMEKPGQESEEK